jgi:signal transduction histidine kinase
MLRKLRASVLELFDHYKAYYAYDRVIQLKYAGLVGFVGYPLFYFIYVYVLRQPYENLPIRLVATVGCFFLAIQKYWTPALRKYYVHYSYFVILYCLPFFHIYMVLQNRGGMVLIADNFMAVFFLVLLTDWRNTLAMILLGGAAAFLLYFDTATSPSIPADFVERLPTFILVILGGSLFKFSERKMAEKGEQEKLEGMSIVLANIAHELRTPLASVDASARGLQRSVPPLIHSYQNNLVSVGVQSEIPQPQLALTMPAIDRIRFEVRQVNAMIDLLLINAKGGRGQSELERFAIGPLVKSVIETYPFESDAQRGLVSLSVESDFNIQGSTYLFKSICVNLIKNGLTAIKRARKGTISIRAFANGSKGRLVVYDTGIGISREQMSNIFKRFHSYPIGEGTGIGLAFCKDTLEEWGAKITCTSEKDVYTEFQIEFPIFSGHA